MRLESGFSHEAQCTYQLLHLNLQTNADKCTFYHILKFKIVAIDLYHTGIMKKLDTFLLWKNINNFESNTNQFLFTVRKLVIEVNKEVKIKKQP